MSFHFIQILNIGHTGVFNIKMPSNIINNFVNVIQHICKIIFFNRQWHHTKVPRLEDFQTRRKSRSMTARSMPTTKGVTPRRDHLAPSPRLRYRISLEPCPEVYITPFDYTVSECVHLPILCVVEIKGILKLYQKVHI